ncbi:hypothetical protein FRC07_013110 [Ceratobasidium sp. 392]|nr:hypothetical protein FRC07_013110 [Ceratobasidium sp. 392]
MTFVRYSPQTISRVYKAPLPHACSSSRVRHALESASPARLRTRSSRPAAGRDHDLVGCDKYSHWYHYDWDGVRDSFDDRRQSPDWGLHIGAESDCPLDQPLPRQAALPSKQAWCPSEVFCAGQLLQSVNLAEPYADLKTFVDKPTVFDA